MTRSNDDAFVLNYFQMLQIRPARTGEQFSRQLEQRHGRSVVRQLVKIMEARDSSSGQAEDIYEAKNASLSLSLDFAAYSADLYRRFFDWFMEHRKDTYPAILDIGCDNGIVTCFLALLYPEARVLGVDKSAQGILCATELAARLGLSNVSFVCVDLLAQTAPLQAEPFNLVLSLRSLHEIVGPFLDVPHWSLRDLATKQVKLAHEAPLQWIHDVLAPHGQFISCERLVSNAPFYQWVHHLNQLGLSVDWAKSGLVRFHEVGQSQQMPALVMTRSAVDSDTVEAIHAFYRLHEDGVVRDRRKFSDALAEAVFFGIQEKQLLGGVQLDYKDGSARLRSEVWQTTHNLLLYQYTDRGYRLLSVHPLGAEHTLQAQQSALQSETRHLATSFVYNVPQDQLS